MRPYVEIEGIRVRIDPHWSEYLQDKMYRGRYEAAELEITKWGLEQDDVVMELGAGVGVVSAFCAKRIGSERVFAYEANPKQARYIRNTYALNHVNPTLELCAVSDHVGQANIFADAQSFWEASLLESARRGVRLPTPVRRFSDEVRKIKPTFVIVDIEGGEKALLDGDPIPSVRKIAIEMHPDIIGEHEVARVMRQLSSLGFTINAAVSTPNQILFVRQTMPLPRAATT